MVSSGRSISWSSLSLMASAGSRKKISCNGIGISAAGSIPQNMVSNRSEAPGKIFPQGRLRGHGELRLDQTQRQRDFGLRSDQGVDRRGLKFGREIGKNRLKPETDFFFGPLLKSAQDRASSRIYDLTVFAAGVQRANEEK